MPNLTYGNSRIIFEGGYIKVPDPPQGVTGLVIWDGTNDYVEISSEPTVTGSKKLSFYLNIITSIKN